MRRTRFIAAGALLAASLAVPCIFAQVSGPLPDAPHTTQTQVPQVPVPPIDKPGNKPAVQTITLDQALDLAKSNNPTLKANRYLILQNRAQEITANLRPNPTLGLDSQYLPFFSPDLATNSNYWENAVQWDAGVGYLFERGGKRQHRLDAAKTATAVTESQVADAERGILANVAQSFVAALLARSNYDFAMQLLESYKQTVALSEERQSAGAMSRNDLLKIQLQQLQFENDVSAARIAYVQALVSLRQLIGFDSVPADYSV